MLYPGPYTFGLFDRLLLLLRGRCCYFGPGGEAAAAYFHRFCPAVQERGADEAAADWLIDITVQVGDMCTAGRSVAQHDTAWRSRAQQLWRGELPLIES